MELFRLFGTIAVNNTEANNAIRDTTDEARNSESKISDSLTAIGGAAGRIASAIGIAGLAIGGAFIATIEATREYRKEMGLLESAFLTAGHSSEVAKSTYSDLNAVMGDSGAAVEAAQHLSLVADNEAELSEMTHSLTGVYATFGASLPLEGLAEAINHSSSLGSTQGSLADALEWSGITVEEFDEQLALCSDEEERQDLIMRTLKDTYSEAADQYKATNADVMAAEKANEALADAFAELGAVGEPILTSIKEKVAEMVAVAAPKLQEFIDKIKDCIKWVKENEQTIQTWVGIILGATVAIGTFLLILNWGSIMASASKAINAVRSAVLLFNAALLANPIGIIVALIAGLVASFIYLWNNVDGFKEFWLKAWDIIKEKASEAWEWIKNTFASIGEWFTEKFAIVRDKGKEVMDNLKKFFSDAWDSIESVWDKVTPYFQAIWNHIKLVFSVVKNILTGNFSDAWEGIKGIWNNVKAYFSLVWSGIEKIFSVVDSWFGGIFSKAWNAIKNIWNSVVGFFRSIWNGIVSIFSGTANWFRNVFNNAWNGIKNIWNGVGGFFRGIWSNITSIFGSVGSWFRSTFNTAWNNVKSVFSGWGKFFGGLWNTIKDKFTSIGTSISSAVGKAVSKGINGVIGGAEKLINGFIGQINGAIKWINKIPGVDISRIAKVSFTRLAKGGVLERGQVGILEGSGAEAVVPLEKNTEWIDRVSDRFRNKMEYQKNTDDLIPRLNRIIELLEGMIDRNIYLDSGALVGELTPAIDQKFGYITVKKSRRNI